MTSGAAHGSTEYPEPAGGRVAVVAVIGGGASGTLATTYLLRAAAAARIPLRIALIDRHGQHGLGRAYATAHPAHLLNSPAGRMSAAAHDPGHLTRWAAANGIKHDGFLPRAAFGRYLRELLAGAERMAGATGTVTRITADVVALTDGGLRRPLRLQLAPTAALTRTWPCWLPATSRPLRRAQCQPRLATSATPGCPGHLTASPTAARWSSSGRASPCWTWRSP